MDNTERDAEREKERKKKNRPLTLAEQFEQLEREKEMPPPVKAAAVEVRQFGNAERDLYVKTQELIKKKKNDRLFGKAAPEAPKAEVPKETPPEAPLAEESADGLV